MPENTCEDVVKHNITNQVVLVFRINGTKQQSAFQKQNKNPHGFILLENVQYKIYKLLFTFTQVHLNKNQTKIASARKQKKAVMN